MQINDIPVLKHADLCGCASNSCKGRLVNRKLWCFGILARYAQMDNSDFYNLRTPHSK